MNAILPCGLLGWLLAAPLTAQAAGSVKTESVKTESVKSAASPAESVPEPDATLSEQIVVTASRVEQRIGSVPGSVTVLEEELERTAAVAVDDVLRQVPGFSLFRRASSVVSHPTTQGVTLRGIAPSGASRTLVLLDGIPLNDAFGGWVYWSRVPQASLERVEVVRGGSSSVWGSDALGGVLNLITARPTGGAFDLVAEAGERSTKNAGAFVSGDAGPAVLSLAADYFDTGGYPTVRADQRGAIDIPATSEHWGLSGRARFAPSPGGDVHLRLSAFDEERGNGTPLTANDTNNQSASVTGTQSVGSNLFTWAVLGEQQEFASSFTTQALDRSSERPTLDQFLVDSESLGTSLQWSRLLHGDRTDHTLIAGGEYRWIDGATNEDFLFTTQFERRRRAGGNQETLGIYLQDQLALGGVELTLGGRVDRWNGNDGFLLETVLADGSVITDRKFADRSETAVSPRLGARFPAGAASSLFVSAYRSFRAPTINELYRPFRVRNDITAGNAALEPETLLGGEAGYRFAAKGRSFELTGFANELEDAVANITLGFGPGAVVPCGFVPAGGSCQQRQNVEGTRILGLEAEYRQPLFAGLELLASYLYSDSEIRDAPNAPDFEGNRVAQAPEHQAVLKLDYRGPVDLALQGRYVGDQFEDNLNTRELQDFAVVDLYAAWAFGERLSLFVGVENLFDEESEVGKSADGLVTIGAPRLVHGGVRLRLRE